MSELRLSVALPAAAVGGVIGSLARSGLTDWLPVDAGFPWTIFWINVVGSGALAAIAGVAAVRRTPWLGIFLGTGVLGGFTTMSAASAQAVVLFDHGRTLTGIAYVGGTLVAALLAVWLVDRLVSPADRTAAEEAGVDS